MGKRERGEFTGGGEQRKGEREMMQSYLISKNKKLKVLISFLCVWVLYTGMYTCAPSDIHHPGPGLPRSIYFLIPSIYLKRPQEGAGSPGTRWL